MEATRTATQTISTFRKGDLVKSSLTGEAGTVSYVSPEGNVQVSWTDGTNCYVQPSEILRSTDVSRSGIVTYADVDAARPLILGHASYAALAAAIDADAEIDEIAARIAADLGLPLGIVVSVAFDEWEAQQ